jgi:hypothetical protein
LSETVHNIKINFEATGIDSSIRNTQRLLYTMNSLRIVVRDVQDLIAKPTIENAMFTAIQLTQLYSNLYRLINKTNNEAVITKGLGVGGGVAKAASTYMGSSWNTPTGDPSFMSAATVPGAARVGLFGRIGMMATAHPGITFAVVVGTVITGLALYSRQQQNERDEYITRMRELAKAQGIEA